MNIKLNGNTMKKNWFKILNNTTLTNTYSNSLYGIKAF